MKITSPDVIKNGEKDLIQAVRDDLDPETVKQIIKDRMSVKSLVSRGGEIIVHNREIAFRLDFSLEIEGSIMFDRQGNYIPASGGMEEIEKDMPEQEQTGDTPVDDFLEMPPADDETAADENFDMGEASDDDAETDMDEDLTDIDPDALDRFEDEDPLADIESPADDGIENSGDRQTGEGVDGEIDPDLGLETDSDEPIESLENYEAENLEISGNQDVPEAEMEDMLKESQDFWDMKTDE